jgi:hypothetical protein
MQCKSCGQENPEEARFCSNCGASLTASVISFKKISVSSSYGNGWRQLWKYFLELFLIGIIGFIIGIPAGMGSWGSGAAGGFLGVLGIVYSILIISPVDYGVSFANLKASRGDKLEIKNMFECM